MGCEPVLFRGRPCDWPGCAASTNPSLSFAHLVSRVVDREEVAVRYIGLDVHREFCEVAIAEAGRVRSAGRIRTRRAELELFAQSLGQDDEVALETTGGAAQIAAILRPALRVWSSSTRRSCARSQRPRPRPTASTPGGWPSSWPLAIWPRSGAPTSKRAPCGASSLAAPSWCASARGPRTRSPPPCSATCSTA